MAISTSLVRRGAAAAVLALGLAACGESGPSTFDPAGTSADMDAAVAAFGSPVFQSFAAAGGDIDLVSGGGGGGPVVVSVTSLSAARARSGGTGAEAQAYARRLQAMLAARGPAAISASSAAIPAEVAGKTFVWDVETNEYVASDRPSVGANTVRFMLYAVDPIMGGFAEPLVEVGYADLSDLSSGSTGEARIELYSGTTTVTKVVDYRVRAVPASNGGTITVSGFAQNGENRANFDLNNIVRVTSTSLELTLDYSLDVPTKDLAIDFDLGVQGSESGGTLDLDYKLTGPNGDVSIAGSGTDGDAEYTVRVNGDEFATITTTETTITIVGRDGQALTEAEQDALRKVFGMFEDGFAVFGELLDPVDGIVGTEG